VIYSLPVIGWLIGFFFHFCLSIPLYFLWNGLAPVYFYWLPSVYLEIPFLSVVGLVILLSILKAVLLPKFSTSVETKKS
jgi:hypothetical protein